MVGRNLSNRWARPGGGCSSGPDYWNLLHPDDRARIVAAAENAVSNRQAFDCKYRILLPDGAIRHIHSIGEPVADEAGNVVKVFGTLTDITSHADLYEAERRHAAMEAQARADLQRHYNILQQALVPEQPRAIEGYSMAARYIPLMSRAGIGGDFYDVFTTEEGKLAIMIGDVSGKGTKAASVAVAARNTVRAFAYEIPCAARF